MSTQDDASVAARLVVGRLKRGLSRLHPATAKVTTRQASKAMIRRLGLSLMLITTCASPASAEVDLRQLSRAEVEHVPGAGKLGIYAGDVLMGNRHMAVSVTTAPRVGGEKAGRIVILPHNPQRDSAPLRMSPLGLQWTRAEAGQTGSVVVLRMHSEGQGWRAELIYRLLNESRWVDMIIKLKNYSSSSTLEIPIVADVRGPSTAELDRDERGLAYYFNTGMGTRAGIVPVNLRLGIAEAEQNKQVWQLYCKSGDPEPDLGAKVKRFFNDSSTSTMRPITPEADWPPRSRERVNWFRIPPQKERSLHVRLIVANTQDEAMRLATQAADHPAQPMDLVPSGKGSGREAEFAAAEEESAEEDIAWDEEEADLPTLPTDGASQGYSSVPTDGGTSIDPTNLPPVPTDVPKMPPRIQGRLRYNEGSEPAPAPAPTTSAAPVTSAPSASDNLPDPPAPTLPSLDVPLLLPDE